MRAVVSFFVLSWGWRRRVAAAGAGAVGALALAPFSFFPAIILSLTLAVWLTDGAVGARGKRASALAAFGVGWWWGFGYFLAGLWWLGSSFLVEADKFAWALPLGVVGLPAVLACAPGLGFAIARLLWSRGPQRVVAFTFALAATEWLRGLVFTGFPWNDVGMALGDNLVLAQAASIVGLHGLTIFAILIGAAPATIWAVDDDRLRFGPSLFAALMVLGLAAFGLLRLSAPPAPFVPHVKLRLIQPDVAQGADFAPANGEEILKLYLSLSDRATAPGSAGIADVTHLIWPESAFPFLLERNPEALRAITEALRGGAALITGAARADPIAGADGELKIYNSILVLDRNGVRPEVYDKRHLVPFGEYLPIEGLLRRVGLTQFVSMPGGFTAGSGASAFKPPSLPEAEPLICYEAIFPQEFGSRISNGASGARWILNLTDDAWFGLTPGPYQHLSQARLRAIEAGLPLVRDANSGISAVIDGRGRTLKSLPLGAEGVLDSPLPEAEQATWHRRFGVLTPLMLLALCLFAALWRRT